MLSHQALWGLEIHTQDFLLLWKLLSHVLNSRNGSSSPSDYFIFLKKATSTPHSPVLESLYPLPVALNSLCSLNSDFLSSSTPKVTDLRPHLHSIHPQSIFLNHLIHSQSSTTLKKWSVIHKSAPETSHHRELRNCIPNCLPDPCLWKFHENSTLTFPEQFISLTSRSMLFLTFWFV